MSAFISCNPASGELFFTRAPQSDEESIKTALRLKQYQPIWKQLGIAQRTEKLLHLADLLEKQRQYLANLTVQEVGRRTPECLAEIDKSVSLIRYYAEAGERLLSPKEIPTQASSSGVNFEPLGMVLAVMPWNYPIWQILRFAIPALLTGNVCLIKPAPSVPLTTQALLEVFHQVQIESFDIAWIAPQQTEKLIEIADALAFTGSSNTGSLLASLAGKHLKKTVMELGGSNPVIILNDADIELSVKETVHSRFRDAGQSCNAAKRIILLPEIAERWMQAFLEAVKQIKLGQPTDPSAQLGPMHRADLREALHAQVLDATSNGAQLLCGGTLPLGQGFYYPATILDQVNPQCRVYREEVFGPVVSILRAKDKADAVRLANDTPYGLGASIYSQNMAKAKPLANQIEAGSVYINRHTSSDLRLPFGGVKASGYGRELSEFGLYEFVNVKTWWHR